jgi:hypothetical protein
MPLVLACSSTPCGTLLGASARDRTRARAGSDLQAAPLPAHGVVVAHLAGLLEAEHLAPLLRGDGHEGGAGFFRRHREVGVVRGQVVRAQPFVGGVDLGDPGERQLLGQAVLQRAEEPLRAPARLRRIGGDMLDAELRQRPADAPSRNRMPEFLRRRTTLPIPGAPFSKTTLEPSIATVRARVAPSRRWVPRSRAITRRAVRSRRK